MLSLPILRRYRPDDFETLHAIDRACYPRGIAYSRGTLRQFLALPGAECLVLDSSGELIGFILTEAERENAHIITIDVVSSHRRAGAGSLLLFEAERSLAARGVHEVHLETAHDNSPAIAFWEKHGYRKRGVLPRYYLDRIDAFWMSKRIG